MYKNSKVEMEMTKYTLRKMPMWGKQVRPDEINFEWPTQEILDGMQSDVSVKSITLKERNNYHGVASI